MLKNKKWLLPVGAVGAVLASIICAHAIGPVPARFRANAFRSPLLSSAALRPLPEAMAPFGAAGRRLLNLPGSFMRAPLELQVTPAPRPRPRPAHLVVPVPRPTPAYRYTFQVLSAHREVTDRYDEIILEYAVRHHMNPRLIKAIIAAESEFSPAAVSPHDARGLMQIMPRTAEELGVPRQDLGEPDANIRAGSAYLEVLYVAAWKQYKLKGVNYADAPLWVVERIIAAYNAGPRALGRNSWMRQTRNYVRKVLLFYRCDVTEFRRSPTRVVRDGRTRLLPREDTLP